MIWLVFVFGVAKDVRSWIRDFKERLPEPIAERGLLESQFQVHELESLQTLDSTTLFLPIAGVADAQFKQHYVSGVYQIVLPRDFRTAHLLSVLELVLQLEDAKL